MTEHVINKQPYSWERIESMAQQLADTIKPRTFDMMLAITRGGLVPAGLLAYHLDVRDILVAAVQFYTGIGTRAETPTFLQFPSDPLLNGKTILIVDDVWDSGKTINAVRERVLLAGGTPVTAVLHYKPTASLFPERPDHFVEATSAWIVYPWAAGTDTDLA